jgi:hypothetical protein
MSYSRRQLYALGEPLGDSVTRAEGGRIIYGDGGGGGAPAETTQTGITELPEWAKGYAKDALAKGAALTDVKQNPYQTYGGQRIAGFQPMQEQSFAAAQDMGPASQLGTATGLAGMAGLGALGTNYQAGRFSGGQFGNRAAEQYMNPYMQNVVDIQQREAQRQADISGTQRGAQAVKSGAFGGSRQAIMDAEAARNLATQKGDIQAQGLNQSYQQAQAQFNADQARRMQAQQLGEQSRQYGAGLGMQGLQTALQSAGQLGQLGQTQFGQQKDIIGIQNQLGQQQQAQAQRPLDQAYQDFLNQQNYPYKQLGFMSDMIRGLPLGQQSTQQMYQAPPSFLQTAGSLGMGAYGLSQLAKADGGLTQSYADGGSVTSENNVANIINKLSPEQLQQAKEAALNRRDVQTAEMIDARLAELAQAKSLSAGLGSAFDQIEPEQQEAMMAGGGIVAFANRGLVDDEDEDAPSMDLASFMGATEGNPAAYKQVTSMFPALMARVANAKYTPMTDEAYNETIVKRRKALEDGAGTSPYADYESKLKGMEAEDAKGLSQAKGLAALQAAGAMLQGGNAIRGLGAAGSAFAGAYGQALQADKAQKRSMMNMRLNLADAQRKERMGLTRDAVAAADQARKDHDAAQQFGIKKSQALAAVAGKFAQATKPIKGTGAGGGPKPLKINEQLADAEVKFENDPTPANEKRVIALRRAVDRTKTSDVGPAKAELAGEAIDEPTRREALKALNEFKMSRTRKRDWNAMVTKHGSEKAASEAFIRDYDPTKAAAPTAAPTPAPAAKSVLPLGTTTGKFVQGKGTEVLKDGKVIGYAN